MLRIAIVGAGTIGRTHSAAYLNIENAKVTAICDIDTGRAGSLAKEHHAKVYASPEELLENEEIDAMDICLPTYLHKKVAIKAMDRGLHVFCEKPIAASMEDAGQMRECARKNGVKLFVGHVVRYFPAYINARQIISEGQIGTPKLIRTTRAGAYPCWGQNNWYSNYEQSGGVLLDLAIHDFDWILHCFGDIDRVYARNLMTKGLKNIDHGLAVLRLKNGAIAHVEGSWAYPAGAVFGTAFEVIGTKGQIEFDSKASTPLRKHVLKDGMEKITCESPLFHKEMPFAAELQEFVNCVITNKAPAVSAEDAIKVLAVSLAAIESSRTGQPVCPGEVAS